TSSEGHRLLADYYRGNSRYETARASELLQSQLWQPLSAYPLQPQLSETGISVVEGSGPQNPGFNEYHSLFTQDGVYGSVTGYGGSDGTWGDDLVGSFLAGPVAVSLGQYHFETDGWRDNSDQEQDIYNGIVSWQATSSTMLQFEYRKFNWEHGDLGYTFEETVGNEFESEEHRDSIRFGLRQNIGSRSVLLLSISEQEIEEATSDVSEFVSIVTYTEFKPKNHEFQLTIDGGKAGRLMFGGGLLKTKRDVDFDNFDNFFGDPLFELTEIRKNKNYNYYTYWFADLSSNLSITAGLEYDDIELRTQGESVLSGLFVTPYESVDSEKYWSPKLGLDYQINSNWAVRLSAFQAVRRFDSGLTTIAPTHVVGFNQYFEDAVGTTSNNLGLSFDGEINESVQIGFVHLTRDIEAPLGEGKLDNEERQTSADVIFPVSPRVSLSVGIDLFDLDSAVPEDQIEVYSDVELTSYPLLISYFVGNGLSVGFRSTYFDQELDQRVFDPVSFEVITQELDANDWIYDFFVAYKFPCTCGQFTLDIQNLGDEDSNFISSGLNTLAVYPSMFVSGSLNLTF
ncbi:MAG: TonB-dependent receptor, partial [Pseudomonadales bacterium]|nr:TonB-dependent receptor [Pseudomonadales bacterium]